jgi:NADPH:quinone reductase
MERMMIESVRLPSDMNAIEVSGAGEAGKLMAVRRPVPQPAAGEVLIRVEAAGLNRGDIMQRRGYYPPPPGITDIPGLEVSGRVAALGAGVDDWNVGDAVCAILAGGGYAEYAVAPAVQCLPIPEGVSMIEAAALPETLFTCWTNVVDDCQLKAGETLLIHGGASGIGTTGIQLARALGAKVFVTAGSAEKCAACVAIGADLAINYNAQDFVEVIADATGGRGVDVVLDMVGGDYVGRSMQAMAYRGRFTTIGMMKGLEATISTAHLLGKRLVLTGSTLRGRPPAEKGVIRDSVLAKAWPMVARGEIKAIIYRSFPLDQAAQAQAALDSGAHIGKVVLTTQYLES